MTAADYWKDLIHESAEECGLTLTPTQLECLAESVQFGHENYGMAFYTPPDHERLDDIEREWKKKLEAKEDEFERYRENAETAVKKALRQPCDAVVLIGKYGEVERADGRSYRIQ